MAKASMSESCFREGRQTSMTCEEAQRLSLRKLRKNTSDNLLYDMNRSMTPANTAPLNNSIFFGPVLRDFLSCNDTIYREVALSFGRNDAEFLASCFV